MAGAYFDQFNIVRLITIEGFVGDWLIAFTNSSMMLLWGAGISWLLLKVDRLVPRRWQLVVEGLYLNIRSVVSENLGRGGERYFTFILCLFIFIAMVNLFGLLPYVFTPTAHIVVTFGLSLSILIGTTLLGFLTFKWNFLCILMPGGAPLVLGPILVIIETISYFTRAVSLGVRLAANLSAGHLLFAILSEFVFNLLASGWVVVGLLPILILLFITLLELAVAVIQAYVFCLLTAIYFADTVALH